jgi:DNA-binding XRE family transcriptional regulator
MAVGEAAGRDDDEVGFGEGDLVDVQRHLHADLVGVSGRAHQHGVQPADHRVVQRRLRAHLDQHPSDELDVGALEQAQVDQLLELRRPQRSEALGQLLHAPPATVCGHVRGNGGGGRTLPVTGQCVNGHNDARDCGTEAWMMPLFSCEHNCRLERAPRRRGRGLMPDQTYAAELGRQLRERRRLLGLNQTEVADLARTTQRTVSQVESGKAASIALYLAVAEVLGLDITARPRVPRRSDGEGWRR